MLLVGGAGHENIVQVDEAAVEAPEHAVHQSLEGLGSVLEAERHSHKLPQTKRRDDGGLGDAGHGHGYVVVAAVEVDFGEDF